MSKQSKKWVLAVFALSLGAPAICTGQPVAEAPVFKVGDYWELRQTVTQTNTPDDRETQWSRKIAEIGPDRIQVTWGDGKVWPYDAAMNFIPEGKPEYTRILVRYPLKAGSEWTYTRKFPNPMLEEKGDAKVVAVESITVPAGTFECFRVDVKAEFGARSYQQRNTWSRWYCPKIKWIAKERHETYIYDVTKGGGSTTVETSELVKFTPGQ